MDTNKTMTDNKTTKMLLCSQQDGFTSSVIIKVKVCFNKKNMLQKEVPRMNYF